MAAAAVQRRKEPIDRLRENEASPSSQGYVGPSHPDEAQRSRMNPATMAAKVTVEDADKQAEDIGELSKKQASCVEKSVCAAMR